MERVDDGSTNEFDVKHVLYSPSYTISTRHGKTKNKKKTSREKKTKASKHCGGGVEEKKKRSHIQKGWGVIISRTSHL